MSKNFLRFLGLCLFLTWLVAPTAYAEVKGGGSQRRVIVSPVIFPKEEALDPNRDFAQSGTIATAYKTVFKQFWEQNSYEKFKLSVVDFNWMLMQWTVGPSEGASYSNDPISHPLGSGEEFEDTEVSDGTWTPGERFQDLNGDGKYTTLEPFYDSRRVFGTTDSGDLKDMYDDRGEEFADYDGDGIYDKSLQLTNVYIEGLDNGLTGADNGFVEGDGIIGSPYAYPTVFAVRNIWVNELDLNENGHINLDFVYQTSNSGDRDWVLYTTNDLPENPTGGYFDANGIFDPLVDTITGLSVYSATGRTITYKTLTDRVQAVPGMSPTAGTATINSVSVPIYRSPERYEDANRDGVWSNRDPFEDYIRTYFYYSSTERGYYPTPDQYIQDNYPTDGTDVRGGARKPGIDLTGKTISQLNSAGNQAFMIDRSPGDGKPGFRYPVDRAFIDDGTKERNYTASVDTIILDSDYSLINTPAGNLRALSVGGNLWYKDLDGSGALELDKDDFWVDMGGNNNYCDATDSIVSNVSGTLARTQSVLTSSLAWVDQNFNGRFDYGIDALFLDQATPGIYSLFPDTGIFYLDKNGDGKYTAKEEIFKDLDGDGLYSSKRYADGVGTPVTSVDNAIYKATLGGNLAFIGNMMLSFVGNDIGFKDVNSDSEITSGVDNLWIEVNNNGVYNLGVDVPITPNSGDAITMTYLLPRSEYSFIFLDTTEDSVYDVTANEPGFLDTNFSASFDSEDVLVHDPGNILSAILSITVLSTPAYYMDFGGTSFYEQANDFLFLDDDLNGSYSSVKDTKVSGSSSSGTPRLLSDSVTADAIISAPEGRLKEGDVAELLTPAGPIYYINVVTAGFQSDKDDSYIDENSNGIYDSGDLILTSNGGSLSLAELVAGNLYYQDADLSTTYSSGEDLFADANSNGRYDGGDTILSTDSVSDMTAAGNRHPLLKIYWVDGAPLNGRYDYQYDDAWLDIDGDAVYTAVDNVINGSPSFGAKPLNHLPAYFINGQVLFVNNGGAAYFENGVDDAFEDVDRSGTYTAGDNIISRATSGSTLGSYGVAGSPVTRVMYADIDASGDYLFGTDAAWIDVNHNGAYDGANDIALGVGSATPGPNGVADNHDDLLDRCGDGLYSPPERFKNGIHEKYLVHPNELSLDTCAFATPSHNHWDAIGTFQGNFALWWGNCFGTEAPGIGGPPLVVEEVALPTGVGKLGEGYFKPIGKNVTLSGNIFPDVSGAMYDSAREFRDMPSSIYHGAGDYRFSEETDPSGNSLVGVDYGNGPGSFMPDYIYIMSGPLAHAIFGDFGWDAGCQAWIEYVSWRGGASWKASGNTDSVNASFFTGDDTRTRSNMDTNLDGFIDHGYGPSKGYSNYTSDIDDLSPNDGANTYYPFHRSRLVQDIVEIMDDSVDFSDFEQDSLPYFAVLIPDIYSKYGRFMDLSGLAAPLVPSMIIRTQDR
ncbi:MAG: hypothetical protein HQL31_01020, partial [Planctomycetes bacterium]|nr:hypothetical protein [Planctomycetota bacterium]